MTTSNKKTIVTISTYAGTALVIATLVSMLYSATVSRIDVHIDYKIKDSIGKYSDDQMKIMIEIRERLARIEGSLNEIHRNDN